MLQERGGGKAAGWEIDFSALENKGFGDFSATVLADSRNGMNILSSLARLNTESYQKMLF